MIYRKRHAQLRDKMTVKTEIERLSGNLKIAKPYFVQRAMSGKGWQIMGTTYRLDGSKHGIALAVRPEPYNGGGFHGGYGNFRLRCDALHVAQSLKLICGGTISYVAPP